MFALGIWQGVLLSTQMTFQNSTSTKKSDLQPHLLFSFYKFQNQNFPYDLGQ